MRPTMFQHAELRDEDDQIVQQGTYGKNSPLSNATNDGWIDYVMNNLEWLYDETQEPSNVVTLTGNQTISDIKTFTSSPVAPTPAAGDDSTKVATTEFVQGELDGAFAGLAPLASPAFTGTPTAPTQTAGDNSTKLATTAYADKAAADAAAALVNSAPGTLDTLQELAAALGDDPNFATTIATLIDTKCAQAVADAKLAAHPVGSYYESTDSTSPATLFGGTWQEEIPDGELVGSIAYFAGQSSAPDGWVLCDGSVVSRSTYAVLFSSVGTTYGTGDGSTTFVLPNLIDKFIEGSATSGTEHSAGLPNITGGIATIGGGVFLIGSQSGAIYPGDAWAAHIDAPIAGSEASNGLNIDASRSNSIYGNSSTVQPPALTMKPFIYTGKTSQYKWLRIA